MTTFAIGQEGRRLARSIFARLGLDVRRADGDARRLRRILDHHGVTTVFDIGANIGEYAAQLRRVGYQGRIVCFEPLAAPHEELRRAAHGDSRWLVPDAMALGDADGQVTVNVAGNVASSSVLDMLPEHERAAAGTGYVRQEQVKCARLDGVADGFASDSERLFLKFDVQGFEDKVLDGAPQTLARAVGLQIELSVVPLYGGCQTYEAMLARLYALGFQLWHLWPGLRDETTARMLQFDAVLMR